MIIDNNVMCVPQQNPLPLPEKITPMAPLVDEDDESSVPLKMSSDVDQEDDDDEQEEVVAPIGSERKEPMTRRSSRKSSKSKKTKKSVRFDLAVTARPCLHKNDYTAHESASAWYGRREFEKIRRELLKTLSLMYAGNLVEHEDIEGFSADESSSSLATTSTSSSTLNQPLHYVFSSRGLEGFTVKGSLRSNIRKLREKAITEVLVEQDFQVDRAESMKLSYLFYDDHAIRSVYLKLSKVASKTARNRGIDDHRVAIGASREIPARPTKRNKQTVFHKMFFKSPNKQKAQRRWSSSEVNSMTEAAAMVTNQTKREQRRSWTSSEKSMRKIFSEKKLWSLLAPKASKPNNPAAMVA